MNFEMLSRLLSLFFQHVQSHDHDVCFRVLVTPPHKTIMGCFDNGQLLVIPPLSLPCLDEVISLDPCYWPWGVSGALLFMLAECGNCHL